MRQVLYTLVIVSVFFAVHGTLSSQTPKTAPTMRHILLEEFSTAPCGFCPEGDIIAAQLVKDHPQVIWVTHHAGFGTDSMTAPESPAIANAFTTFAPGAAIDRGYYPIPTYTIPPFIAVSRQKWDSVCNTLYDNAPMAQLDITPVYNDSTRELSCTVMTTFTNTPPAGDIRVNAYVVEDSVVGYGKGYDQKNYFNAQPGHVFYQKGDSIYGYQHHRVVRKALAGAWGTKGLFPLQPDTVTGYSVSLNTFKIPKTWNTRNLDIIAYVSYYHDSASHRQVINSNSKRMLDGLSDVPIPGAHQQDGWIYTNPVSSVLHLRHSEPITQPQELSIYTLNGQRVRVEKLDALQSSINLSDLSDGTYIMRISTGATQVQSGLLVVLRD